MWGITSVYRLAAIGFFCFFSFSPFVVHALGLAPAVLDVGVVPGEETSTSFSFQNTSSVEKKYSLDLLGVTLGPAEGDRAFFELSEEEKAWFSLLESRFILAGGASRTVPISIHPPAGIPPQVFVLGVRVLEEAQLNDGIALHEGAIELVFVTIGSGLEPDLSILSFEYPSIFGLRFPQQMVVTMRNDGEGVAVPTGSVVVTNLFGAVHEYPMNPQGKRVPPGQTRTWSVETPLRSLASLSTVSLVGEDGLMIGEAHRVVVMSPWVLGGIIGGAILFVVATVRWRKRQQK